ncbi:hypothetical protein [uncultured Tenacibaculum sp.]|uniref:hypothetical protein n=1 Tax=uncultured Tenacibaculum sp. TaxID=174713 RepID=UPI00260B7BFD|nr:hypothetical protein [uncultured Tenacibaculum sp.]
MKNVIFALAFMLIGTIVFANSNTTKFNSSDTVSVSNELILTIDLGNLTKKTAKEINTLIGKFLEKELKNVDDELQCKVTAKGSVGIGRNYVEISVEVSGPCSEIRKKGQAIANEILKEVKNAMK